MKEFFGFGGYTRPIEGYFSWQHLLFVSFLMTLMIALAVTLGLRNKSKDPKTKNKILIFCAILIDALEITKIIIVGIRASDPWLWRYDLPLFLCSIQLITIPLAAFSKGRIKEAALDFVLIFGILGAVFGTYFAGQNYGCYPVLSFDNVISGVTHSISGFCSLYIAIAGMSSMKRKNIPISFSILLSFCIVAYIANLLIPYNYMFLMAGDGTPYDILYNWVGGNPLAYPLLVVALFLLYISAFYAVYFLIQKKKTLKT